MSLLGPFGPPNVEKLKAKGDVQGLIKALNYDKKASDWRIRQAAAHALGEFEDPRAVEPLIAALEAHDFDVRQAAAEALVKIGSLAVEPLVAVFKDSDWRVRQAAAKALGEFKDPRAVEPLITALEGSDADVQRAAADALVKIGPLAVEPLIGALKDNDRHLFLAQQVQQTAVEALMRIGPRAVDPLITALKSSDRHVRNGAARALEQFKDPRAVEPLKAALKDISRVVRDSAAKALDQFTDTRTVEPRAAVLKDSRWFVRDCAEKALEHITDLPAEPLLAAVNGEPSQEIRQAPPIAIKPISVPEPLRAVPEFRATRRSAAIEHASLKSPESASRHRVVGVLVLSQTDLQNKSGLLWEIATQQSKLGYVYGGSGGTKEVVQTARGGFDDAYVYAAIRSNFADMGGHDLMSRAYSYDFSSPDGTEGKYYVILDQPMSVSIETQTM